MKNSLKILMSFVFIFSLGFIYFYFYLENIENRMIDKIDENYPNVKIYEINDLIEFTPLKLKKIDYIDFRHSMDLENNRENIIFWKNGQKIKIIYSEIKDDGSWRNHQIFLDADQAQVPYGYRCKPHDKIFIKDITPETKYYWISPQDCMLLTK